MSRVALLCPGRGSYTDRSLGTVPADHPMTQRAEALRAEYGLPSLVELDRATKFSPSKHLAPAHATMLIWLLTQIDAERVFARDSVVVVGGNSMGWYSALSVAGALSFDDGFHLAQQMALLQEEHAKRHKGGQVLYPLVDDAWQPVEERTRAVEHALSTVPHAFRSIHLGGYVVLAGDEAAVATLLDALPPVEIGSNRFPLRLAFHGPYHTPLVRRVTEETSELRDKLTFREPAVTLVDGRGLRHTPWSCDVDALADYTFGHQVYAPYDFTATVRVALREYAPDRLVLTGPGNPLGGVCGQILVAERWAGLTSRKKLDARRDGDRRLIESLGA